MYKLKDDIGKVIWTALRGRHFTFGGEVKLTLGGKEVTIKPLEDQELMRELYEQGVPYIEKVGEDNKRTPASKKKEKRAE